MTGSSLGSKQTSCQPHLGLSPPASRALRNSCSLSRPVCGTLFQRPLQTNTDLGVGASFTFVSRAARFQPRDLRAAMKCLFMSKAPGTRGHSARGLGSLSRTEAEQARFIKLIQHLLNCEPLQTGLKPEPHATASICGLLLEKEAWAETPAERRGDDEQGGLGRRASVQS